MATYTGSARDQARGGQATTPVPAGWSSRMSTARFIVFIVLGVFALQHLSMTLRFPPANISAFWTG